MKTQLIYSKKVGRRTKRSKSFMEKVVLNDAIRANYRYTRSYSKLGAAGSSTYFCPRVLISDPKIILNACLTTGDFVNWATDENPEVRKEYISVSNQSATVKFVNPTNQSITYRIYECQARNHSEPGDFIPTLDNASLVPTVITGYLTRGWDDDALAFFTSTSLYQNSSFCQRFKITGDRTYLIPGGQDKLLKLQVNSPVKMRREDLQISPGAAPLTYTAVRQYMKGSRFFVFQMIGGIISAVDAVPAVVTTSSTACALIIEHSMTISLMQYPTDSRTFSHDLVASGASKHINEETLALDIVTFA